MGLVIGNYSYTFPCAVNILHPLAVPAQPFFVKIITQRCSRDDKLTCVTLTSERELCGLIKNIPYLSLVILKIAGFKKNILCNKRYFFALF